ncbi:raffinose/stachyose/melibiose transport system substrate-binding protein [Agromyces hippuratus]|uniref:Raffinose/stachyose/melibiose transport system substrate-binding protein n=1 Tax=Agromyces hippuratus TaxID=286438 RepID=A0A852X9J6_9MICO|nr:extracellular solute-binding protein [Agromyces hippuratus]NYG22535.1 raffinose/stachyose/melibiose transport system substrate-binding protein [Agromyces hippuratus]
MKRNIRLSTVALGGAALVFALAGCAPGTGSTGGNETTGEISTDISGVGDVTLTVWDQEVRGGQNEQMEQLNAAFMEKYPNVTIDRNSQSFDDLATTLRLALTDADAPDVVQANNGRNTMGQFVAADQLRPLDDYAEAYGWGDRFSESVLQYSTYSDDAKVFGDGSLYGLPQVGEVVGIFYSKSKLADLGLEVPADWTEFDAALKAAKAAGETPMQLGNIEKWPALHVFGPLQGDYVDAEVITDLGLGNAGQSWTTPENVEAAATLQGWVDAGYFNDGVNGTDYDAAWQALAGGDGVFLIGGSWLAADLGDAMGDDVGFFIPNTSAGTPATTGGTGLPFTITSAADNTDVAAAYLDFITSDEAMEVLAETGNLPVNRTAELAPDSGVQADVFTVFGDVTGDGSLLPYLDYATPTFGDTMGQALQDLLAGQATPEQFTEALEADYSEFVASNE